MRKPRVAHWEHRDSEQYARKRRQKAADRAKANAEEHAKTGAVAIAYAKEQLEKAVGIGAFVAGFEKGRAGSTTVRLHGRVCSFIDAMANDTPDGEPRMVLEYLERIAAVSSDASTLWNKFARQWIEGLPADNKKYPPRVKNYILDHLLRNFEDPARFRAYHLSRGQRIPNHVRDTVISNAVEMTTQKFGLKARRSSKKKHCGCSCVHQALKQLGVHYLTENAIKDIYEKLGVRCGMA